MTRKSGIYLGLVLLTLAACGCQLPVVDRNNPPPAGPAPTYRELAESYNRNLAHLTRIRARAVVTFDWTEEGKHRREQGDGPFICIPPDRLLLKLNVVNFDGLLVGCNARQYWFFDLREDRTAYVGAHARIGTPGTRPLPAPIYPLDVPRLLGMLPIPVSAASGVDGKVTWSGEGKGAWVIEPPGAPGASRERSRLYLDSVSRLPVRIELLDAQGRPTVSAKLTDPMTVETEGMAVGPRIASRIEATVVKDHAKMVLFLSDANDGGPGGIKNEETIFDFRGLLQMYKPRKVEDLDVPAPQFSRTDR